MDLTTQMVAPITDVITNNTAVLVGIVIVIAGFGLLLKLVKRSAR